MIGMGPAHGLQKEWIRGVDAKKFQRQMRGDSAESNHALKGNEGRDPSDMGRHATQQILLKGQSD